MMVLLMYGLSVEACKWDYILAIIKRYWHTFLSKVEVVENVA
jgi:hypothetical protein